MNHQGSFRLGAGIFDMLAELFSLVDRPRKTEENNILGQTKQESSVIPKSKVAPSLQFVPGV